MKQIIFLLLTVTLSTACNKHVCSDNDVITGKLVYRSCATTVIQVLDSNYFHLAQATWQRDANSPVFSNVFSVSNTCSFPNLTEGAIIKFKLITTPDDNCAICALWDNPPQKTQIIKVVSVQ